MYYLLLLVSVRGRKENLGLCRTCALVVGHPHHGQPKALAVAHLRDPDRAPLVLCDPFSPCAFLSSPLSAFDQTLALGRWDKTSCPQYPVAQNVKVSPGQARPAQPSLALGQRDRAGAATTPASKINATKFTAAKLREHFPPSNLCFLILSRVTSQREGSRTEIFFLPFLPQRILSPKEIS